MSLRPRRYWQYVSPRRHGAGVFLLALLLTATYAYWYLTNDTRICKQAQAYLHDLTGWSVKIRHARFTLFGGVELQDVRIYVPQARSRYPFFAAHTVVLKHTPWRLFATGEVQPTEIVCTEPVVTFESEMIAGEGGARGLLGLGARRGAGMDKTWPGALPPIRLREGKLQVVQSAPAPAAPSAQTQPASMPLNMSMIPADEHTYTVTFEERGKGPSPLTQGSLRLNVATGEVGQLKGYIPSLPSFQVVLPEKYRKWLDSYAITGAFHVTGNTDAAAGKSVFEVRLENLSLKLPEDQGGFGLVSVSGKVLFREGKIELKEIAGRLQQVAGTSFRLSGEYGGYEDDSPYVLDLEIEGLALPMDFQPTGGPGEVMASLQRMYNAAGRVRLSARFERLSGGKVAFTGTALPQGMSILYRYFPYRLDDVKGSIVFSGGKAELKELTGRHGRGEFAVTGTMANVEGKDTYDVTVQAKDALFDQELQRAIPPEFQQAWKTVNPGGTACAVVRVRRGPQDTRDQIDVDLTMNGQSSMTYSEFPYRLEGLVGQVRIAANVLTITHLRGSRGPMRCTITGTAANLDARRPDVDLTIDARQMPLDNVLLEALGGQSREAMLSLHPAGMAPRVTARLSQAAGKDLEYNIRSRLEGVSFLFDAFPYAVSDAAGELTITPDRVLIRDVRGRHDRTPISINAQVFMYQKGFGLDLRVEAPEVVLDKALYDAVPEAAQKVWNQLSPAGLADMSVTLQSNTPERPGELDYRLVMKARNMQVKYECFPYPFSGIAGRAIVTPGRIDLRELTSSAGAMRASLDGTILPREDGDSAELAVSARNVPIDATLLAALPSELAPLAERFKSGGTCDLDLRKLKFVCPPAGALTAPGGADSPAGGGPVRATTRGADSSSRGSAGSLPATVASQAAGRQNPAGKKGTWSVEGTIAVKAAVVQQIGKEDKELTGRISGQAARTPQGMELNAEFALDSLTVSHRRVTDLRGRLIKSPSSPLMRVENLVGSAHGGRLAGFAEVQFLDPLQYGISLYVEDVSLSDLFGAGGPDKKAATIEGLLTGNLQLTGTAGRSESQQALGTLRITKGKLYKLPVLLGFLNAIMLSLPGDSAFTDGYLTYRLRGETLILDEIHLTGPTLSLVGSGTMDTRTEKIRLTFLTGPPGKMPRVQSLAGELVKMVQKELMEIEVTGTLDKPLTRTIPLRALNAAIRRVLRPDESKE